MTQNPYTWLRERALALPEAKSFTRRLTWSFFRGPLPAGVEDEADMQFALARFYDWAVFAARPGGGLTLAERAIARASNLSPEAKVRMGEVAMPRYSAFQVDEVGTDAVIVLDLNNDEALRLTERRIVQELKGGELLAGPLFSLGNGEWLASDAMLQVAARPTVPGPHAEPGTLALELEASAFGADATWITRLDAREWAVQYEAWRSALEEHALPHATMMVQHTDEPGFLPPLIAQVDWWTPIEVEVFRAFAERAGILGSQLMPPPARPPANTLGPKERGLIALALYELRARHTPEELAANVDALMSEWLSTPRAELGGVRPIDVIEAERNPGGEA